MGTTYILHFDSTGKTYEGFTVPKGKVVYLVRAPQVSTGTATVQNLLTLNDYVIPDGQTVLEIDIPVDQPVALAFLARSNQEITFVNVEIKSKR